DGPGTVTFSTSNSLTTQATFSAAGAYILRLTAIDGQQSASSDTTIVVNPSDDLAPQITSISNQVALFEGNLLRNPGNEEQYVNGVPQGWVKVQPEYTRAWLQATAAIDGTYSFYGGDNLGDLTTPVELYQDVDMTPYASLIATGNEAVS